MLIDFSHKRHELREDPRFADHSLRSENRDELLAELGSWVASFHDEEKLEVAATDWAKERGVIVEVDDRHGGTKKVPNTPWRFSNAYRGEHNAQVFSEILDLDSEEISR